MYEVTVFIHGPLAESLVRTLWLILGSQPDIETYYMEPGCNLGEMKNGVKQSTWRSSASDQEALVPIDLMYRAPFNTMIQLEEECSFTHITGINLLLLIEVINRRLIDGSSGSFGGLADIARKGIVDSRVLLQMS